MPVNLTISYTTTLDRTTGTVYVTDTTNYIGNAIPINVNPNAAAGYVRLEVDTGSGPVTYYNNLLAINPPDVEVQGGAMVWANSLNIPIPLTTQGLPLQGKYIITYRVIGVDSGGDPFDETLTQEYTFNVNDIQVCIETSVNCTASSATSVDDTNYEIPNGTISSIQRDHTLYPPPASGQAALGPANLITLTYQPIYTTTWTAELVSTVTYNMDDGLIYIVELSGIKEFAVTCETNLNKILCCLVNLQQEYSALECSNPVKASLFKTNKLDPTLQHVILYLAAQSAGNANKIASEYAKIIEVSGCGEDCGCSGTAPALVSPQAGAPAITYVVDSLLNTIVVTTQTAGNTTTYFVDIDPALLNTINNLGTTTVSTTTPQWLTISQIGLAPNFNYRVNFNSASIPGLKPQLYLRFQLTYNNAGPGQPFYNITRTVINNQQAGLILPSANHVFTFGQTTPNQQGDFAILRYQTFFDNTVIVSRDYVATTNIMRVHNATGGVVSDIKDMECEVFWFNPTSTTGDIYLRLYNTATGQPYTLADLFSLNGTNDIYISLLINVI